MYVCTCLIYCYVGSRVFAYLCLEEMPFSVVKTNFVVEQLLISFEVIVLARFSAHDAKRFHRAHPSRLR